MKRGFLLLALMGTTHAQDQRLTTIAVNNHMIGVYTVSTAKRTGIDLDEFVAASAPMVRDATERLNAEVCGSICRNTFQTGIVLTTINSRSACPIVPACPKGMEPTGHDIHSHPASKSYLPNPIDELFVQTKTMVHTTPDMFSAGDMRHPNAYLIGPRIMLHHDGVTVRVVQPLLAKPSSPQLLSASSKSKNIGPNRRP